MPLAGLSGAAFIIRVLFGRCSQALSSHDIFDMLLIRDQRRNLALFSISVELLRA